MDKIFYLHIKKAGGTSMKKSLSPNYVRTKTNLTTFIGRPKKEWNDIINNGGFFISWYKQCLMRS